MMVDVNAVADRSAWPTDPVAAVVHPDPYPYYDELADHPLARDDSIGLWVAAGAADVAEVLAHPAALVRPPAEPIPAALSPTPAGDVFGRLVRMNDRDDRSAIKEAIVAAIDVVDSAMLERSAAASAHRLLDRGTRRDGAFIDRWITEFSIGAIAHLLGIDDSALDDAVPAARDLGACFGPVPPPDSGALASAAVAMLSRLCTAAAARPDGLAASLAASVGAERAEDAVANLVGLLFQAVDGPTGLVGNTLARVARHGITSLDDLRDVVADVVVNDPSVHNTRRFFGETADIAGQTFGPGDVVLVVLAAANRDRTASGSMSFGAGVHQCPASVLAPSIAELAVAALLDAWPDVVAFAQPKSYRPLPNTRIPVFGT